ncbi:MAG: hypothetical protein HY782_15175 [Chloroflexi bacterium]|nr:hypothetical protein [Chloroflexota bacterium]
MGIEIADQELVHQIERIAQREGRAEIQVIAEAVRLYEAKAQPADSRSFLLAIADLGSSGHEDIAERAEEILASEIDPLHGWNIKGETR